MPMWRGYGLVLRGWALAAEGRPEDGASLVRQGIAGLDALGTVFHRTHHLGLLADIHARLGDPAAGLRLLEEAYEEVARTEVRLFEAELRRLEGELRLLAGEPEAGAEACFVEALAVARRQEAKSLELRAPTGLAPPWRGGRAPAWPACGGPGKSVPRRTTFSPRSTAGSPKGSARRTCGMRRRCS